MIYDKIDNSEGCEVAKSMCDWFVEAHAFGDLDYKVVQKCRLTDMIVCKFSYI